MINSKPRSAVLERMGSDSAAMSTTSRRSVYARQLCTVAEGNFGNILSRAGVSQLLSKLSLDNGEGNIASVAVFFTCDSEDDYWQLPIASKKLACVVRLLSPKADFLRSNVTLLANPPLSKEFQGESR